MTDSFGNVVQTYEYDSFGKIVNQVGSIENLYTYTGREYDEKAGLYFYRARYYDANTGRFIQGDPIGFAGGDVNFYVYVQNNPVNWVDPDGLWSVDIGFTGGTGRAGVNIGIKIGSSGVYGYYGVGIGGGFGVSATVSTDTPSLGIGITGVARAGTGTWGGYGSVGVNERGEINPNIGGGWGVGWGWNAGVSHTFGYSFEQGWDWGLGVIQKEPCP